MIAGGSEATICEIGIAGFASLTALTTESDPDKASVPFDKNRSGFVMGEGAGVFILIIGACAKTWGNDFR